MTEQTVFLTRFNDPNKRGGDLGRHRVCETINFHRLGGAKLLALGRAVTPMATSAKQCRWLVFPSSQQYPK
jgi:hypothetical protein